MTAVMKFGSESNVSIKLWATAVAAGWVMNVLACGGRTGSDVLNSSSSSTGGYRSSDSGTDLGTGGIGIAQIGTRGLETTGGSAAGGYSSATVGTGTTTGGGSCCATQPSSNPGTCCTGPNCATSAGGAAAACGADAGVIYDVPLTCADYPADTCGLRPDGLGGVLDCGICVSCVSQTCEQACSNAFGGEPSCQSTYDVANGWIVACMQLIGCGAISTCWCRVG